MHPSAKLTIAELRQKCRNKDYSKWVHRPARFISIYVTKLFLMLGITANMTSTLGFVLFIGGFGFFVWPAPIYRLIGLLLMLVAELFDYVDGELARAYGHLTKTGVFLESFYQDINYTLIFLAVGSSVYFETHQVLYLYLGFAAVLGKIFFRLIELRFSWHVTMVAPSSKPHPQENLMGGIVKQEGGVNPLYWIYRLSLLLHHNVVSGAPLLYLLAAALFFDRLEWFLWFFGTLLPLYWIALSALRLRTVIGLRDQAMR